MAKAPTAQLPGASQHTLKVPAHFDSDEPIRPRSKIKRRALPLLCFAFCWPKSVPFVSQATGLSGVTVRALYLDLRELLLDARYRKWHSFSLQSAYETDPIMEPLVDQIVWSSYAACYENRECQRNFLYGKRAGRECTNCPFLQSAPLMEVFDETFRAGWLNIVDRTRRFYLETLKIRRESGWDREIFKRRAHHQQIIAAARYNSRSVDAAGEEVVNHFKDEEGSVIDLWSTILVHIEERGWAEREKS